MTRQDAQSRADRIREFREELATLEAEGALILTPEQRVRLDQHLSATLSQLAAAFDIDTTDSQKQVSWGMRIVSTLGGLALCAATVLFFYRYWGMLPTAMQAALMIVTPLAAVIAAEFASRRETTLYFTSLIAIVAVAAFILDLHVLGRIFDMPPTANAFLAWSTFGFALAYRYGLRLQLAAGVICAIVFIAAECAALLGGWWQSCFLRPELFLFGGLLAVAAGSFLPSPRFPEFAGAYRLIGLSFLFVAIFVLSLNGSDSFLPLSSASVEKFYEWIGLAATAATIWIGIRRQWPGIVTLGAAAFSVFLYLRLIVWWWDWIPHYLFFLIVAMISITLLAAFRRVRARV
jgi:uncharacterized membrane protein